MKRDFLSCHLLSLCSRNLELGSSVWGLWLDGSVGKNELPKLQQRAQAVKQRAKEIPVCNVEGLNGTNIIPQGSL